MADSEDRPSTRQTITGALIAGGVAVVIMFVLSSANVGSTLLRSVAAIAFALLVAQLYERTR